MTIRSRLPALFAALVVTAAPAGAQTNSGYDPRSWVYDDATNAVIPPSTPGQIDEPAENESAPPSWSPIPKQVVSFGDAQPAGTIIVNTNERRLYYVLGNGKALRYAIGVGKEGFEWAGSDKISDKKEWPDWRPPQEMRSRVAASGKSLPIHVAGGPNNPLGARALYIGNTLYRIHGTNQPWTVGKANSSGCIRLTNEDVIDLYARVQVGAHVIVRQ
nr:L,D-transpeptidase [Mesorhizobium loti]